MLYCVLILRCDDLTRKLFMRRLKTTVQNILTLIAVLLVIGTCRAQDVHYVHNTNDSGPGSLRDAVALAQSGDAVIIATTGTLNLLSPITINEDIIIQGPMPAHFTISAATAFIHNVGSVALFSYIDGIKFTGSTNSAIQHTGGSLFLVRCVFDGNSGTDGGAVYATGPIYFESCSFLGNSANQGGALSIGADASIINCTFSQNTASVSGGAIMSIGGLHAFVHNTFKLNDAPNGGAIDMDGGSCEVISCLFTNNGATATSTDPTLSTNFGSFTSMGGNFIDSDFATLNTVMPPDATDVFGSTLDPLLDPILTDGYGLSYYPIATATSPAVDIGGNAGIVELDQRRGYRVMQGNTLPAADAGAIEFTPFCVTNLNGTGSGSGAPNGSLGWAVDGVNSAPNPPYSICFKLPGPSYSINAMGSYIVTEECIIDGYTQAGSVVAGPWNPLGTPVVTPAFVPITIDGSSVPGASGLVIRSDTGAVVRGLTINNFSDAGLIIGDSSHMAHAEGMHLGTNSDASVPLGNNIGLLITNGATETQIGDWYFHSRNVISDNDSTGILVRGTGTFSNRIYNSFIGVNGVGAAAMANGFGVVVLDTASGTKIGDSLSYGNVISGNIKTGVLIADTLADVNGIYGNFIGTDASGTVAIGNHKGIVITKRANLNAVGGLTRASGNLISGNDSSGVECSTWANLILSNFIGTDISGILPLGNGGDGIYIPDPVGINIIGGAAPGQSNIICDNDGHGINVVNGNLTSITGNLIGVGIDSLAQMGNTGNGILLDSGSVFIAIGGALTQGYNTIVNNGGHGIETKNSAGGHTIAGNWIGTIYDGVNLIDHGNTADGIHIEESSFWGNTIGDSVETGPVNLIAYNGGAGISIQDNNNSMFRNHIYANGGLGIDLDADGVTPNDAFFDIDFGANSLLNFPVLNAADGCSNGVVVDGSLQTHANQNFRIEFFATDVLDPTLHGEGAIYIGHINDSTDASGNATFNEFIPVAVPAGWFITANSTALDGGNNTSEFSEGVVVAALTTSPTTSADVTICDGDPAITISATPVSAGQIVWATDNVFTDIIDTALSITITDTPGVYVFYAAESISGLCLTAYDSVIVTIVPVDDPFFGYPSFCDNEIGSPDTITTTGGTFSIVPPPLGTTSIDPVTGAITNAVGGTTYNVQYVTSGPCPDTSTVSVFVREAPTLSVNAINEACEGDLSGSITASASGGAPPYQFALDAGIPQASPVFSGLASGTYNVHVSDDAGCETVMPATVSADVLNTLDAGPDRVTCPEFGIVLNPTGNGTSWYWPFGLVEDSLNQTPFVNPVITTTYFVIMNDGPCSFTDSVTVTVNPGGNCDELVPNAFSPNEDGVNDIWEIPFLTSIPNNVVSVFNRWGDRIIQIDGYDNMENSWDGTNASGELLPTGTYFYTIELTRRDQYFSGWVQLTY